MFIVVNINRKHADSLIITFILNLNINKLKAPECIWEHENDETGIYCNKKHSF